jgi:hypothetical protein
MTKMLTESSLMTPLPESKEYYSRITKGIDELNSEGGLGNHTSRIIEALIQGILWSPEAFEDVEKVAMKIGMEMFNEQVQNAHPYDIAKSPDNPENWKAKIEVFHNHTRISTVIQAWQAKNGDGSPANWEKGTPDGDRWLTQVKIIPHDKEKPIKYQNHW